MKLFQVAENNFLTDKSFIKESMDDAHKGEAGTRKKYEDSVSHGFVSEVYFLEGALLSLGSCRGRQEELWSHTQKGTFQGLSNED